MGLFSNFKSDGIEESQDRLGGFSLFDADIYVGKIKNMYAGKSSGGAMNVTLILDFGGKEYRETVYVSSKEGKNYFEKDGKKMPLPGFTTVNDACLIASGKELADQITEDKIVKIWNPEEKKEVPTNVPVLVECLDKPIAVGIQRHLLNKEEKGADGEYHPTAETQEKNAIDKVFHPEFRLTVPEAREKKTEPAFWDAWVKRNKGQTQDRRKLKDAQGGAPGTPPKAGGAPTAAAPKKSLFGK